MKPLAVRTRLTLYYTAALALVLAAMGVVSYRTLAARLDADANQRLEELASGLRGYLHFEGGGVSLAYDTEDPEEAQFIRSATRFFQVYDAATGQVVLQSPWLEPMNADLSASQLQTLLLQPAYDEVDTEQERLRFHNSVVRPDAQHTYLLRVGINLDQNDAALQHLLRVLLLLAPAGLALAAFGGWWMALRPVRALRRAAHRITIAKLDRRLPLRGAGDEFDQLADTFNQVLARLEDAVAQMQQFTASISHELRTPLTALQGEAEVALLESSSVEDYRRVLRSQLEELQKLSRMIHQLLVLARAEGGEFHLELKPVDLAALVRSLAEQIELLASDKGVQLAVGAPAPVTAMADAPWIERLVLNLLDNAIKFTPAGGCVSLTVKKDGGTAVIEVADTGAGIPEQALPHIFERFYRADQSRSAAAEGVGLGLALVHWIAEAHRGKVEVHSSPGQGSRFKVMLPSPISTVAAQS